jgi:hypothetical protein
MGINDDKYASYKPQISLGHCMPMLLIPNLCPTAWTSDASTDNGFRLFNSFHNAFGAAVKRFLSTIDAPYAAPAPATNAVPVFTTAFLVALPKAPPVAVAKETPATYVANLTGVCNFAMTDSTWSSSISNENGEGWSYLMWYDFEERKESIELSFA